MSADFHLTKQCHVLSAFLFHFVICLHHRFRSGCVRISSLIWLFRWAVWSCFCLICIFRSWYSTSNTRCCMCGIMSEWEKNITSITVFYDKIVYLTWDWSDKSISSQLHVAWTPTHHGCTAITISSLQFSFVKFIYFFIYYLPLKKYFSFLSSWSCARTSGKS